MQALDHVAPVGVIADQAVALAEQALPHVLRHHRPLGALFRRQALVWRGVIGAWPDVSFLQGSVRSLLRWWGWIEPLGLEKVEEQLLIAVLMDTERVSAVCGHWARSVGRLPQDLIACGDAPTWTAKSEGFKRLARRGNALADPWKLFPEAYREIATPPPGAGPIKSRQIELIAALQTPSPVWLRATGPEPERVWDAVRAEGWKPWVHRRMKATARLEPGTPAEALAGLLASGLIEVQDLGSQLVAQITGARSGQRWWVPLAERGSEALHLAAHLEGKGLVVATGLKEEGLRGLVKRARSSPYRNLTTRVWDGRHVAGKAGSFDGVLLLPASTAIGTWRRAPEGRWLLPDDGGVGLAERQLTQLRAAAGGVRPGGKLVYAVPTLTTDETAGVIEAFLGEAGEFALEGFESPLDGTPTPGMWTLWPKEVDSDGWFYARMRRRA